MNRWIDELSATIVAALSHFASRDAMERFAVDCHPWNGAIILALLTTAEAVESPFLVDPAEMAAWRHYEFATPQGVRDRLAALGREMRAAYDSAGDNRRQVAESFLKACASAVDDQSVLEALSRYERSPRFRITVPSPDSNVEFYRRG